MNQETLLDWDVRENLQGWLSCFDSRNQPRVGIGSSGQTVWAVNFPLPDKYKPDFIDFVLVTNLYPTDPPKGIYLLSTATNRDLIAELKKRFNVFQDTAYHGAPGIEGYEWICFGYLNGWRFNANAPHKGDNIGKMMQNFWRVLEE